jgi:hypothetical protein
MTHRSPLTDTPQSFTQEVNDYFFRDQFTKEHRKKVFQERLKSAIVKDDCIVGVDFTLIVDNKSYNFSIDYKEIHTENPIICDLSVHCDGNMVGFWTITGNPLEVWSTYDQNFKDFMQSIGR